LVYYLGWGVVVLEVRASMLREVIRR